MINIETNKLVKILGRVENTERFLSVALYQGVPKKNSQYKNPDKKEKPRTMDGPNQDVVDPMVICSAFNKNRFFMFTRREPGGDDDEPRDIFNERPSAEERDVVTEVKEDVLGDHCVIRTTLGDIHIKLFKTEAPKTVENFCVHARNGYYDNLIFHRCIKNFMIQTGDPRGDGTGGESIWGGEFEDEFHRSLRHDRPFTVSMANAGPGTNGSQFFITTIPTPWLDNKHTVFGRVTSGMDTCTTIENVTCDKLDKPYEDVKMMNIEIS
jgi:peptidylprolyl isomerase domain and WD repeat-containing protein 1